MTDPKPMYEPGEDPDLVINHERGLSQHGSICQLRRLLAITRASRSILRFTNVCLMIDPMILAESERRCSTLAG
ncbi:uncharacterized protein PHALS_13485 [Plasmopara halstedii]|uniref:Uncharacterized protein n=1 Tax=Plasmopara halstedii TaxID=4781 RepID=A0A0P1AP21_PLAHL|nr:uncharacterized protein PHALS_13485 [Plasmopara halstedii]CEG43281.1 hypothetical protein PHALS_13485 [Plasmopara halstedii]|eukprot:XP_024579650.1 hypothetical protein PHALS_13485 [Plasmopara halstedii]